MRSFGREYFKTLTVYCEACGRRLLALTFDLLLGPPGVSGGSRRADVVPVDVLQEHLCVPAGQRARLKHQHSR